MNTMFATGHTGAEPTPTERLRRLREDARMKARTFKAHPCHPCEIAAAQAEQALEDFLEQHPELG